MAPAPAFTGSGQRLGGGGGGGGGASSSGAPRTSEEREVIWLSSSSEDESEVVSAGEKRPRPQKTIPAAEDAAAGVDEQERMRTARLARFGV